MSKKVVKAAVRAVEAAAPVLKVAAVVVAVAVVAAFVLPEAVVAGAVAVATDAAVDVTATVTGVASAGASEAERYDPPPVPAVMLKGADEGFDASTPVGNKVTPIQVAPRTNLPGSVGGREYSGHALDQMQGRGIFPSVIENTIKFGQQVPSSALGTTRLYESTNNVTVVLNSDGGVVTAFHGR